MAMNGGVLGAAIKAAVQDAAESDPTDRDAMFAALGDAIVAHIQAFGSVTVAVTSVSGVTAGAGVSGPGSGTGTIA
jgi:hypothetical protein